MAKERTKEDHVIPMRESELHEGRARIKVVGCGGGGGNAVNRMISKALKVQFIAVNTDKQALERCQADIKVQMGSKLTRGLGAGGDWTRGRDAADESRAELSEVVKDSDMVFITAGMGGGTGTGSESIVAQQAKEQGALTIGVVTRPFAFEGRIRNDSAEEGIKALRSQVDALIVIPNDRLAQVANSKTTLEDAFRMADDVLRQGVQGISDLVTQPGVINLDFADVKAIMENAGEALMGIGHGAGDSRAEDAAKQAVSSPLLETSIDGAKGILFNITAGQGNTPPQSQKNAEDGRPGAAGANAFSAGSASPPTSGLRRFRSSSPRRTGGARTSTPRSFSPASKRRPRSATSRRSACAPSSTTSRRSCGGLAVSRFQAVRSARW